MGTVSDTQPCGEKIKKAVRWIGETLQLYPNKERSSLIKEAEIRFDLSPRECEFLDKNFSEEISDCK